MPTMMIKSYLIEYFSEQCDCWKTLVHNTLNLQRLDVQYSHQTGIRQLRLTVLDSWGGDQPSNYLGPRHFFLTLRSL
jgi:hypothetical protein